MLTSSTILFKQTDEREIFTMDFTSRLLNSETITGTPTISIEDSSTLVASGIAVNSAGKKVQFWLIDGEDGERARVNVTVVTSTGETKVGDGLIKIRNRA